MEGVEQGERRGRWRRGASYEGREEGTLQGRGTKRTGGPSICNISKVSGTRSGFGKRVNLGFLAVFVSFHHRLGVFLLLK